MTGYVQVSTATATREQAVELAQSAVKAMLAAGVQIVGPVSSIFVHLGEFGQGEEWQLLFKTTKERYPDLESFLLRNHPWKNPEVAAVPILFGTAGYLEWISRTTGTEARRD